MHTIFIISLLLEFSKAQITRLKKYTEKELSEQGSFSLRRGENEKSEKHKSTFNLMFEIL
jgi:hypothetical protein